MSPQGEWVQLRIGEFSVLRQALSSFERVSYGDEQGDLIFRRTVTGMGKGRRGDLAGFLGLDCFREAEAALWKLLETGKGG